MTSASTNEPKRFRARERMAAPGGWWWLLAAVLVAAAGVCVWFTARDNQYTIAHRQAAALTSLLVITALGVAAHVVVLSYQHRLSGGVPARPTGASAGQEETVRFRRRGLKAAIIGADGRASTSKTQVVLWTVAVIAGLVDLLLLTRSAGGTLFTDAVTKNWRPEYLVLLGLPAAAATVAKASVTNSNGGHGPVSTDTAAALADATHQAAVAEPASAAAERLAATPAALALLADPRRVYARDRIGGGVRGVVTGLAELLTTDTGEVAWTDLQYAAFTLIAVVDFAAQLVANPTSGLPPVPAALLTLTGVSATTYSASKALETRGTTTVAKAVTSAPSTPSVQGSTLIVRTPVRWRD